MARAENDSWDITESVGATALGVAAARAAEAASADPLVVDPYAKVFLDAAGNGTWSMFASPDALAEIDPELPLRMRTMVDYMASRTAFFDEFFLAAADAGVRQAVILASGLDARAWRLGWPDGMTVYEIDQPKVLDFKTSTLAAHGAQPGARLVEVPVDLRHDWPQALRDSGFDADSPAAWSAEGLLPFLPAQAQDLLFDRIHALSAPGSRIAVEALRDDFMNPEFMERQRAQMQHYRDAAAKLGRTDLPGFEDLWYFEERADVADWLRTHGWQVAATTSEDLLSHYHRSAPHDVDNAPPRSVFVSAQRP